MPFFLAFPTGYRAWAVTKTEPRNVCLFFKKNPFLSFEDSSLTINYETPLARVLAEIALALGNRGTQSSQAACILGKPAAV